MFPNDSVPAGQDPAQVADPQATQAEGGVAVPATPAQPVEDATAIRLREFEDKLRRNQEDLNRQKSTFQQNEARLKREFEQQRREYDNRIEQLKLASMDEEQKKAYEVESARTKAQNLEQQLGTLQKSLEDSSASLEAMKFFISKGVPADSLVTDQGYDTLFQSGWGYIMSKFDELANAKPGSTQQTLPVRPLEAPPIVSTTSTPASPGPSWSDLIKQYGSEEIVYRMVETGQLPVSIIPKPRF